MMDLRETFTATVVTIALSGIALSLTGTGHAETLPFNKEDNAKITLVGDVVSQTDNYFILDYGQGKILVEMDDFDPVNEAELIEPGELVTVRGVIDDDLYEEKKLEAQSVYVVSTSTYYYADAADEEGDASQQYDMVTPKNAPDGTWFGLSGMVLEINDTEFTMNTGYSDVTVETAALGYDPFDYEGNQQIRAGDTVYVSGYLDKEFFDNNEIEADSIIVINDGNLPANQAEMPGY